MSLTYLLESSVCIGVLYLFYYLFLKNSGLFTANRFFLLGSILFSLTVPLLNIDLFNFNPKGFNVSEEIISIIDPGTDNQESGSINGSDNRNSMPIISILYYIGIGCSFIWFGSRLLLLFIKRRKFTRGNVLGIKVWLTHGLLPTSSFVNEIYWDETSECGEEGAKMILYHERVHIQHYHSIDIMLLELLKCVFWFNPIIWVIKNEQKNLHEYIADQNVSQEYSHESYSQFMLSQVFDKTEFKILNDFASSKLKDRIKMITNKNTRKMSKLNYLFSVIPFMFLFLTVGIYNGQDNYKLPSEANEIDESYSITVETAGDAPTVFYMIKDNKTILEPFTTPKVFKVADKEFTIIFFNHKDEHTGLNINMNKGNKKEDGFRLNAYNSHRTCIVVNKDSKGILPLD